MRGPPTWNSGAQDTTVRSCSCFLVKYVSFLVFFMFRVTCLSFSTGPGLRGKDLETTKSPLSWPED